MLPLTEVGKQQKTWLWSCLDLTEIRSTHLWMLALRGIVDTQMEMVLLDSLETRRDCCSKFGSQ